MTFQGLLEKGAALLAAAGVEEAELEARLLLQHVCKVSRSQLFLQARALPSEARSREYLSFIQKRCTRIPLQHITGSREFWSLDFTVSPDVLIPRPETEFMLDHVLSTVQTDKRKIYNALDLCTGSGVIGVVLAKELDCQVTALDISPAALSVASENCAKHGVAGQVSLLASDLFSGLQPVRAFDLIVSNPPYIAENALATLSPEVKDHEPRLALTGGEKGLDYIKQIISESKTYLKKNSWLFIEIGMDQGALTRQLFITTGGYSNVTIIRDWSGRDRVAQARLSV
ncbi:MAG: protein-(glutamine-N5) methyltransferase, release factor-specific [Desulfobulbus propionicus]|nr:MAG: protein-(glutamine-N5) methyltransferase, release factor-specific [Desulfobulbus propionicus]